MLTVTKNQDGSFTVMLDLEGQALFGRVVTEKGGGLSDAALLDQLLTNWLRQHNANFDEEDFRKLTPKQRKKALDEGKKAPT